jgi:UDP-N-acetylmuramoyl-L-alanyl-D-glutamate--2,6-diaminopimelate ligase
MNTRITIPEFYPVTCHTDNIGMGSTFVAVQGMKENGNDYIIKALERGAHKIVVQENSLLSSQIMQALEQYKAELIQVPDTRLALAQLSAQAYNYPAHKLRIIGITGTKGKTTSSFLLAHVLRNAGYRTALLSTVKNRILDQEFGTHLTTQQPDYLHTFFNVCVEQQIDYVVMEVAAQATSLHRVAGIEFDGLIFTNFSQEHAEFYATQEDYFSAKTALFKQLKQNGFVVINNDDERVSAFGKTLNTQITIGLHSGNIRAEIISSNLAGLTIRIIDQINASSNKEYTMSNLVGNFNVYNTLGVYSVAQKIGLSAEQIKQALLSFTGVPGRLQRFVLPNKATAFIDYAHNPSSFQAVLSTVRSLSSDLIVVFGAGGDRDATKRPIMGSIVAQLADKIIITSDNPRSEDPEIIAQDIMQGINAQKYGHKIVIELDREEAIKKAYAASHAGSMIMLLGKGPDEYQIVKGVKSYFSEAAILRSL